MKFFVFDTATGTIVKTVQANDTEAAMLQAGSGESVVMCQGNDCAIDDTVFKLNTSGEAIVLAAIDPGYIGEVPAYDSILELPL